MENMNDDLISRQAAIDAVHKAVLEMFDYCDDDIEEPMTYTDEKMLEVNKLITAKIRDLPSAQPEPEHTMEEFMYGQDLGSPEDGSL